MEVKSEEQIIRERKEKFIALIKTNYNWIAYILLAFIVWIAVKIRMAPMKINPATGKPGLWDITRDHWTLGPDLDPFLFLRWAKEIIQNGSLMPWDSLRYVPLGYDTAGELILLPYSIAWFHKFINWFGNYSIEYSAVLYPVFMFALTVIAFFFLTRKIFVEITGKVSANIIALIASFFLAVLPSLLPRTIAGIPEKESAAFLFLFLAFYFFISAWKTEKQTKSIMLAVLAGASTAAMALIWGGYLYAFLTIGVASFLAFFLGKVDRNKFYIYGAWLLSSLILMYPFSTRYAPKEIVSSTTTLIPIAIFFIMLIHFIIFETKLRGHIEKRKGLDKVPRQLITLILSGILGIILVSFIFGPSFFIHTAKDIAKTMIVPVTDRLGVTVAENRQPYFAEWANSFGPSLSDMISFGGLVKLSEGSAVALSKFPIIFWLFFIGSIYLFFAMFHKFEIKERGMMTVAYAVFLICLIFSRYSPESQFNGTNGISTFVYGLGFIILLATLGFYYYKEHQSGKNRLKSIDFGLILLFIFFFLSIVSARGSVRTIMVLVPTAAILASYFVVTLFSDLRKNKDSSGKVFIWIFAVFVALSIIFAGYAYYNGSSSLAKVYIPSPYTYQWQQAMDWVRDNTPQGSVFGHWWDYGYWVQTMGERATVLDGGNAIVYWNHLMGRYALTGANNTEALEFLYSHNTTHFIIDSSDIGKYGAFSSIGSDVNYDRRSWISTFQRDDRQSRETKNSTVYLFVGGTPLDDDIIYNLNGSRIILPAGRAGVAAIILEFDANGSLVSQPEGVFVYNQNQYRLPLRYAYVNKKFLDFGSGVESGVFTIAALSNSAQGLTVEKNVALLYLSSRTVKSQLARLYLYKEDNPNFKLVHSQDEMLVAQLKAQYGFDEDFIFYGDFRGPLRIWEINYPNGMKVNSEYVRTSYPDVRLSIAQ
ncbi:MAG: STT3 domain-containing protein [Nanoarchaeota archaeon]|nr:STT3 domain-containing protein [Nanoarchaeota archaeon]